MIEMLMLIYTFDLVMKAPFSVGVARDEADCMRVMG